MSNTKATTVFKSYEAKIAASGRTVRVINEGKGKTTGEPMVKVQEKWLAGYYGDHTPRADWRYTAPRWIKKSDLA